MMQDNSNEATTKSNRKRATTLGAVAMVVMLVVGVASWKQSGRDAFSRLDTRTAVLQVRTDGLATEQTGVYYLKSDHTKCFVIKSSPWGAQQGWVLEPSNALASTMISAFGWVAAVNPTRGKVMIWNGAKQRKEAKFVYLGTTMTIDGVEYERRPKVAPWECKTELTSKIAVYARTFGAGNCQWLMWNQKTTGFVIYYTKGPGGTIAGGGGYYDAAANKGQVAGYHHTGVLDGPYDMKKQANPPAFWLYQGVNRFANGAWDFLEVSSCADPGYPTVTQTVGASPTYPSLSTKTDSQYRVTAQASWSQAAVACLKDGLTLCTMAQYCPGGAGSQPQVGRLVGDVWAPIADKFQNFVQVADPNRICSDHLTRYKVLPKWEYYGTVNTAFRCCTRPSQLSALSLPLQELVLNDAEYRFILDGTYKQAEQACAADGMRLCNVLEYCPNGPYSIPLLGLVPGGDVWAPIKDSRFPSGNNWVQVGDGRMCNSHFEVAKALPTWTSCCTGGKKTPFRCCH